MTKTLCALLAAMALASPVHARQARLNITSTDSDIPSTISPILNKVEAIHEGIVYLTQDINPTSLQGRLLDITLNTFASFQLVCTGTHEAAHGMYMYSEELAINLLCIESKGSFPYGAGLDSARSFSSYQIQMTSAGHNATASLQRNLLESNLEGDANHQDAIFLLIAYLHNPVHNLLSLLKFDNPSKFELDDYRDCNKDDLAEGKCLGAVTFRSTRRDIPLYTRLLNATLATREDGSIDLTKRRAYHAELIAGTDVVALLASAEFWNTLFTTYKYVESGNDVYVPLSFTGMEITPPHFRQFLHPEGPILWTEIYARTSLGIATAGYLTDLNLEGRSNFDIEGLELSLTGMRFGRFGLDVTGSTASTNHGWEFGVSSNIRLYQGPVFIELETNYHTQHEPKARLFETTYHRMLRDTDDVYNIWLNLGVDSR
ncbi:TPA: hypothetical protein HA278_06660 [Candidatus Woesearchaeota archaeon]|nr:hypothetical protein [archaeon]HIJ11714.1 hypothetical protein [Candidatus Woesearchaeota archaeon]